MPKTYLKVYKRKKKFLTIFLALCSGITLFGLWGMISTVAFKRNTIPALDEWNYLVLLFQGILGIYISLNAFRSKKYFVEYDDLELRYYLPKTNKAEHIKIPEIDSVTIQDSKVRIEMQNNEVKFFNLNYFYFPERRQIIEYFKKIPLKAKP